MAFDTDESGSKAAFNSSLEYCRELTAIRRELILARITHDISRWFDLLEAYYISLSARFTPKMQEENDDWYNKVNLMNREYTHAAMRGRKMVSGEIFRTFRMWEIKMRKDEDKLGLLMFNTDDPSMAISQGGF